MPAIQNHTIPIQMCECAYVCVRTCVRAWSSMYARAFMQACVHQLLSTARTTKKTHTPPMPLPMLVDAPISCSTRSSGIGVGPRVVTNSVALIMMRVAAMPYANVKAWRRVKERG